MGWRRHGCRVPNVYAAPPRNRIVTVSDSQIARRELTIAGSTVAVAGMLSTVGVAGIWWWLAPLATLGTALLTAASDRCREGL